VLLPLLRCSRSQLASIVRAWTKRNLSKIAHSSQFIG
jgi:hypothetical protein